MLEVDEKIKELKKLKPKKLARLIKDTPVPVVIAPGGELYIVDKHHFVSVCFNLGIKKVKTEVIRDFTKRKISYRRFWLWMFKTRNSYPYCQFGEGPRKALYLPDDIRGLS